MMFKKFVQSGPIESLERRVLFAATSPSIYEQYLIELVNRGRADPAAEATRYGVALNEGLAAGTITTDAKQPLAINPLLVTGARGHSQWMLDNDKFQHEGPGGNDPGDRMQDAGYSFTGNWTWGENIAYRSQSGTPNVTTTTAQLHADLFIDTGIAGRGHRTNLMNDAFREVGPGVLTGNFNGLNAVMLTEDFAKTGSNIFLTGVAFTDGITNDNFYTPGEGLDAVTITATRVSDNAVFTTTTWDSGGYSLPLAAGTYDVVASGQGLGGNVSYENVVIGSKNVKRDFRPDQATTSGFSNLTDGVLKITGNVGVDTIALTSSNGFINVSVNGAIQAYNASLVSSVMIAAGDGNDVITIGPGIIGCYVDAGVGDDTIVGGDGNDTITGGAGKDREFGGLGDDRLNGNGGHDRLYGEAGKDRLYGGDGNDILDGGSSTDRFWGGIGNNTMYGQGGDDYFYARENSIDTIAGGSGTDHGQVDDNDDVASLEDLLA